MTPRQSGGGSDDAAVTVEDVEARAARLGITAERVLQEIRRLAFSDISRVVAWDDEGKLTPRKADEIGADGLAAIAEIVASASTGLIYRIKLHDKRPALETLMRHLDMLPAPHKAEPNGDDDDDENAAIEFLAHEIDRLAAETPAGGAAVESAAEAER